MHAHRAIPFALLLIVGSACAPSNKDFAAENAPLAAELARRFAAVKASIEATPEPADCTAPPPGLTWALSGPHSVEFVSWKTLNEPHADGTTAVTYATTLGGAFAWLDPQSKNFLGKKDGSVTPLVQEEVAIARGLTHLVVSVPGPVDESGHQAVDVFVTSFADGKVLCGFRFDAAADPKQAIERYDHVVRGTGQVVNQHQVGFSDRLAASLGQNFKQAVKTKLGISLQR